MLEVIREEVTGELRGSPHDEGGVVVAPRDDMVREGIVNQLVSFSEKGRWD